jgi:CRISPR-associated protein Cas1
MKRFLNTLFITTQESYLAKDGECVAVKLGEQTRAKIPIHTLSGLVLFGQVSISPFLLGHCGQNGVTVSWLTEYGRFLGSFHGPTSGNVLLRRTQYRISDDPQKSRDLARAFCVGKIYNCRTVLRRAAREREDADIDRACERLGNCLARLERDISLDEARGIEGEAAQVYFSVFDKMILAPGFTFNGRNRRPPLDEVNCLLSFLYTLLTHDIRSALESVGLDPQVGFLHRDRPGRPSLALDLIEEFRPWQADRLALTLINKKQLVPKDFQRTESGAILLRDEARKTVLTAWQERKRDEMLHPYLNEKLPIGLMPQAAARLLASHIRGDLDLYPPLVLR